MKYYTALNDIILSAFDNAIDDPIFVTEEEVCLHLKCVRAGKSNGPDAVPNWVFEKFAVILVAIILTILITKLLLRGRLPRVWKLANMCPIAKSDQVSDVNKDLLPISLTSTLCKIAEEVIVSSHLKPTLLTCMDFNQSGFVPGSCTTFALILLIHRWSEVLDKSDSSVRALLLDYRIAFNVIDHNILCKKLQGISVRPLVLKWISDFYMIDFKE